MLLLLLCRWEGQRLVFMAVLVVLTVVLCSVLILLCSVGVFCVMFSCVNYCVVLCCVDKMCSVHSINNLLCVYHTRITATL